MRNGISVSSLSLGQATVHIVSLTANGSLLTLLSLFRTSNLINLYVIALRTVSFYDVVIVCLPEINLVKSVRI